MTTLGQVKKRLQQLKQRQDGPPPVTVIELLDPDTMEPAEVWLREAGGGWKVEYRQKTDSAGI